MSGKFERKVEKADPEKLSMMYLDNMNYDPSNKEVEKLRTLSEHIPDPVKNDLQFAYYASKIANFNDRKFQLLTGYGQCRGSLVSYNGDIVVCCCREMAGLVAYCNAHYFRGRIHVPGQSGNASRHGGEVFIITDERGQTFKECPFCEAPVTEKIDFYRDEQTDSSEE